MLSMLATHSSNKFAEAKLNHPCVISERKTQIAII